MTVPNQKPLGNTLWSIADQLRGAMDADDFRDNMLSFLSLRYLSDNYETTAKKELGRDYPNVGGDARKVPLALWYANNVDDIPAFEKQMRRKVHYVIRPGQKTGRAKHQAPPTELLQQPRHCLGGEVDPGRDDDAQGEAVFLPRW